MYGMNPTLDTASLSNEANDPNSSWRKREHIRAPSQNQNNFGQETDKKYDLTNSEGPVVTKEAVLSVLRDPDFKNELNKMISSLIHNEFAKLFDNLKAELSPYVYKAGINLKKLVEREFPGGELTQWKYFDQKGVIYGYPEELEVDLIKHYENVYLCDIREIVDIGDVVSMIRIGRLYKATNSDAAVACVMVTKQATPKAQQVAVRANIRIILVNQ